MKHHTLSIRFINSAKNSAWQILLPFAHFSVQAGPLARRSVGAIPFGPSSGHDFSTAQVRCHEDHVLTNRRAGCLQVSKVACPRFRAAIAKERPQPSRISSNTRKLFLGSRMICPSASWVFVVVSRCPNIWWRADQLRDSWDAEIPRSPP